MVEPQLVMTILDNSLIEVCWTLQILGFCIVYMGRNWKLKKHLKKKPNNQKKVQYWLYITDLTARALILTSTPLRV